PGPGDLAISSNPEPGVVDVTRGNKSRNALLWAELRKFGFVGRHKINSKIDIEPRLKFSAFQLRDRLFEELAIQIETDGHDVAALGSAENAAGAADFEIAHGDAKTGAERAVLLDRVDSFARGANGHPLARQKEISVSFVLGPTDPPAQLIKNGH